jgi:hypothetical protein
MPQALRDAPRSLLPAGYAALARLCAKSPLEFSQTTKKIKSAYKGKCTQRRLGMQTSRLCSREIINAEQTLPASVFFWGA